MSNTRQPVSTIDALAALHGDVQVLPASYAQRRFFVLDQLEGGAAAYTIPIAQRLTGPLDVVALERALNVVVKRHETLRTVFGVEADDIVQVVLPVVHIPMPVDDLGMLGSDERESHVLERAAHNANATFDLTAGPLLRSELIRLTDNEHVLLLTMHHIIGDGWSVGVLFDDMERAYAALVAGNTPELPALALQYPDFSVWQHRSALGAAGLRQTAYWTTRLASLPTLDLATDHPRPPIQTSRGDKREIAISPALSESVRVLARRELVTPYVAFLAAWVALLHRYTSQTDLIVGSITSGRGRAEVEHLIGPFVNTLAIRSDASGDPSFRELLQRVRDASTDAIANQDVPFEQVVEAVQPTRDRSRSPVFQVAFQLLDGLTRDLRLTGVTASRVAGTKTTTKFELTLILNAGEDGALRALMEYNTDLFSAETADRMLGHYAVLLESIVRDAAMPISRLPMLALTERDQVISHWNATSAPLPTWTVPQRVLEQAAETPDVIAVRAGTEAITYRELVRRAAIVSDMLAASGVHAGERVAVAVDRTATLPVALLGVLCAHGAYVPIDTSYPAERIAHVLSDAGVRVVLTDAASRDGLPVLDIPVITLSDDTWRHAARELESSAIAIEPEALAYVLYTSGSTGKPKGVMVPHRALANFLASMSVRPGIAKGDAIVAVTTISFDIAGLELWLPLVTGATVVLASRETSVDGVALRALFEATARDVGQSCALLQATPATWRLLLEAGWSGAPNVVMLCGGEAWPVGLADSLVPRGSALWNMYGPTETTIWSSVAHVTDANLSLGEPIANTTLLVREPSGEPAPIGVPGELWIGGAGLANGYHNLPHLTAEKFVNHGEFGRLYRTGDRVRRLGDGRLVYLGRLDDQVKVRGYRIELGEIEQVLSASSAVAQSVATVYRSADGSDARIVAYVVLLDEARSREVEVMADLAARARTSLPEYMLPTQIVRVDSLPLTPNGKVDRRALPAPTGDTTQAARPYVAPRTPLEQQIADVWAAVLHAERVGINDDFFSLGGHSLAAMRVVARLAESLPVRLTIGTMFDARTVAGLATLVAQRLAEAAADDELAALLAELEGMSDADATRQLSSGIEETA